MYEIDEQREAIEIDKKYQELISLCRQQHNLSNEDEENIFRAFTIANRAHANVRRKSGEPYIFHPLEVAIIAVKEIGIGPLGVVCALLHDVVEDTDTSLEELRSVFGDRAAKIIDGLTKISDVFDTQTISLQAENFKKILLAMCDDVYVILLKLCDRLHNMRTLDSMIPTKQLAISSETEFFYIPLAHRLGLYSIKTELEELVMKYTNPKEYAYIKSEIEKSEVDRNTYIDNFTKPIRAALDEQGYKYVINGRVKSISSIWKKMVRKGIPFNEVFDVFAIRIILDLPPEDDKDDCFKVQAIIMSMFKKRRPDRSRDWISTPKNNGYESLHLTVMGDKDDGKWVEIQIRSKRMDEIAEKGMAAHFLYKEYHPEEVVHNDIAENWLRQIRENLENADKNALDFVEEFKQSLYTKEIYTFTPKGKMIILPAGSSVLDFAFAIHTELGLSCMGAKVNSKVVPNNYMLKSGEQVQILSSKKIVPSEDWLSFIKTTTAKSKIKDSIRDQKKKSIEPGQKILSEILEKYQIPQNQNSISKIKEQFSIETDTDLYYKLVHNIITEDDIKELFANDEVKTPLQTLIPAFTSLKKNTEHKKFLLDKKYEHLKPEAAECCNPVPGDDVVGFIEKDKIVIHRTSCKKAINEMSLYKDRIVKAKWHKGETVSFLAAIEITAIDRHGLLQELTRVISEEMDLNIRSLTLEGSEGIGKGIITVYVSNLDNLNHLIKVIQDIDGIENVTRI